MFSLRDPRFVLCSRDLDVLRAQRIIGVFILITHKPTRAENPITRMLISGQIIGSQVTRLMCEASASKTLTLSLPKVNLTKPRKLINPELSNES